MHPRTITQIVVTDIYTDGDGGYASLKSGGPGMDFAVIHLKSQRGHGYHFTIDFYGQWTKFHLWIKKNVASVLRWCSIEHPHTKTMGGRIILLY